MPPEIRRLADAFLNDPVEMGGAAGVARRHVEQAVVVEPPDKREALRRLIASEDVKNALIFCNRKRDVDILYRSLSRHGLEPPRSRDMPQAKRTETLERFKNGEIRLLVASDVAARGLDIQGLSHVFDFDVPRHAEDYVHRIGRTGRAGRRAVRSCSRRRDGKSVAAIEKLIGATVPSRRFRTRRCRTRRPGQRPPPPPRAERERPDARAGSRGSRAERRPRRNGRLPRSRAPGPQPQTAAADAAERDNVADNVAVFQRRPTDGPAAPPRSGAADEPRVIGFGDALPAFLAGP